MASLESVRQKVFHAYMHLETLKSEMMRYFSTNPCAMVRDADSTPENPTFSFATRKPIPQRLPFIIGDCLQNLRSALDYLVWELVKAASNEPGKKNMFPVCLTAKSFEDALKSGRLDGIDVHAIALIDQVQPYHAGESDAPGQGLFVLDDLTNINKHRHVLLTLIRSAPAADTQFAQIGDEMWALPSPTVLDPNTEFGSNLTPQQMEMHGNLITFIALHEGAAENVEVILCLTGLISYVSNDLLPRFQIFFE
jgi:hypothetical protein